ncbi:hypothetical protein [Burkholderia vietnamiensis]|uniref:hypothetical protein n=1 Tax=Burkholderia vietnamiensis TaxID=60552 RepID=UPI001CF27120|nr:hypothetical protein [Burkholderia vietnamiensis]MCA8198515.1 hypothetical protein [Burkholderia vietnamiensis]
MPSISSAPDERHERAGERRDTRNRDARHEDSDPHARDRHLTSDRDGSLAGRTTGWAEKQVASCKNNLATGRLNYRHAHSHGQKPMKAILTVQCTHWKQKNTFI